MLWPLENNQSAGGNRGPRGGACRDGARNERGRIILILLCHLHESFPLFLLISDIVTFQINKDPITLPMSQHRHLASAGSEQIVGKLNGALAVFRKERDDLFRSKELSHERLRLIVEERLAMEKTVNVMQGKLNELNSKIQGKDDSKNLETLQTEVERLDQEVSEGEPLTSCVKCQHRCFMQLCFFLCSFCRQDFNTQN